MIAYSLGQPASGTQGDAAELLQLLPVKAPLMTVRTPKPGPHAATDALNWWVAQLDEMFSVVSDPAVFSDAAGIHSAPRQMQAVLTAEQLFRRVASLQVSHRDLNARRVLLFTVLDTLTRLKGGDLGKLFNLSFARKTLEHLKETIPTEAAEILLPAAERAVKALEGVQDGFYLRRQLGTANVELAGSGGRIDRLAPEKAAAEYLTLLRNATHGHGTNKSARVDRTNALLAHHTGHLPDDLDLLGYLYLLDVLARPRELRRRLYSEGR
ncbi:hypothetical protein ACFOWZ_41785 [Lentzea rhizosphaerae]|uniref:ApeA N-terminal domain-containing protein n=1 Tax=Lentzea rhizosphaerae TaxID=2041025 RepID=A0ABV8C7G0_9PSEU